MALVSFLFDYCGNKVNDALQGGSTLTVPATWYYGIVTDATTPTPSGGQTEVSGGSYARVAIANNSANYPASVGRVKQNAIAITFATPTADWGNCVGLVRYDAASGGNAWMFEVFSAPIPILSGAIPLTIPIGAETVGEQ